MRAWPTGRKRLNPAKPSLNIGFYPPSTVGPGGQVDWRLQSDGHEENLSAVLQERVFNDRLAANHLES